MPRFRHIDSKLPDLKGEVLAMLGFELVLVIPVLLFVIFALYESGLPRHPRLAAVVIAVLVTILVADVAVLAVHLSRVPF